MRRCIAKGQFLLDAGYSVLFLGYYLWEDQAEVACRIPLDYVEKAIQWLKQKTKNPNLKIGMTGISQGALYTLACASKIPEINSIALASPFDRVMEATTPSFKRMGKSVFTWHGEELPYTEWKILDKSMVGLFFQLIRDKKYGMGRMLRFAYDKNGTVKEAEISSEKMKAHVLLLAAGEDDCWPSEEAVVRIENRLKAANYPYIIESYIYEKGCHNMGGNMEVDGRQGRKLKKMIHAWTDHPEECLACIEDSKKRIIEFFEHTL